MVEFKKHIMFPVVYHLIELALLLSVDDNIWKGLLSYEDHQDNVAYQVFWWLA
jgi:hypothetical protein